MSYFLYSYLSFWLSPVLLILGGGLALFLERKLIGLAQKRLGISFMGRHGWIHIFADVVKFWTKNTVRGFSALDYGLFGLLGGLVIWSSLAHIFVVSGSISAAELWDYSAVWYVCYANISSVILFSVVFSSRSKYSLLAASRISFLAVFLELTFTATMLVVYLRSGSASMEGICALPSSIILTPLLGLYLLALMLFEARRAPFDHTEAESELVAGHLTEFGGRSLLLFFIAEYVHVFFCLFSVFAFCFGSMLPAADWLWFYSLVVFKCCHVW